MPGPALHHLIVDRLRADIQSSSGLGQNVTQDDYDKLQALLADPENLPYLFLGCHGPDFMFFNLRDLDPTLGDLVAAYNDVADFLRDFEQAVIDAIPDPILDALAAFDEAANQVITDSVLLSEIQQTFNDINAVATALQATLTEALKAFVSDFNLFDLISHPYRDGASEGDWWWFDAMHYRHTGKFTEAMLEATRDKDSPLHLYAIGYLTHAAADTVGHAYVNLYSGGPYRSHGQRHKTGENFQDVFTLFAETGTDWNFSQFHNLYNFNFTGSFSPPAADNPRMPADLAGFIADTLNQIYQEDADPAQDYAGRITAGDVDDAYRLWYRFMKSSTETGTLPPPRGYSFTAELREVWEKATDNLDDVGDFLEDAADTAGDFGILSIFIMLAALIIAAVMAAAAIADAVAGAIVTLGTATIRYAASLIYEQLFNAFQMFRLALSLNGLGFPMLPHLGDPRLRQFITPSFPDPSGVTAAAVAGREPLLRFTADFLSDPTAAIFNQERHLIYPITSDELVNATPAPPSYLSATASHYAFGEIPLSRSILEQLVTLQGEPPGNRREADMQSTLLEARLGNAVSLSGALYDRWAGGDSLPDFNLDSDRGYGYLCWTQTGDAPNEPGVLRVLDSAGNPTPVDITILS